MNALSTEPEVTRATVFAAAEQLIEAGTKPTMVTVREALGGGAYTTISPLLNEWKEVKRQPNSMVNKQGSGGASNAAPMVDAPVGATSKNGQAERTQSEGMQATDQQIPTNNTQPEAQPELATGEHRPEPVQADSNAAEQPEPVEVQTTEQDAQVETTQPEQQPELDTGEQQQPDPVQADSNAAEQPEPVEVRTAEQDVQVETAQPEQQPELATDEQQQPEPVQAEQQIHPENTQLEAQTLAKDPDLNARVEAEAAKMEAERAQSESQAEQSQEAER